MRRARALLVGVLLPCVATPAQIPAHAADVVVGMDSTSRAALRHLVDDARRRGLPDEPLLAKVREGQLKRASGARIATAVGALAARLDSARSALGTEATVDELTAGADALAAGAAPSALRTVRDATALRPISVPLGVLAQLVASGVSPARALTLVVELLHRNVSPVQVLAYGNAVEVDVTSGMPADESALFRLRTMGGGTSGSTVFTPLAQSTTNATRPRPARRRP